MTIAKVSGAEREQLLVALDEALADAHIPSLIAALVHITGDTGLLDTSPRPAYGRFEDNQGELPPDIQSRARNEAVAAAVGLMSGEAMASPPDEAILRRMMDFVAGADLPERYIPLLREQLAIDGCDPREPDWSSPDLAKAGAEMFVVIIGAGVSGLLMAIRLKQAGIAFQIIEKSGGVGGTWRANSYPGCRVDTPSHLYSYSFERNHEWPSQFSKQDVLRDYFERITEGRALADHIRFNTEVMALDYDEDAAAWNVATRDAEGRTETIRATHVVSAVGQLNQPKLPDIAGLDSFAGPAFHSAQWCHDIDLTGKRVGVIGTGASAFQFVPEIAGKASEVVVFQRSPPWLVPTLEYHDEVPAGARWLIEHFPFYGKWLRFRLFWKMTEGIFEAVMADEKWDGPEHAIGVRNAQVRDMLVAEIERQCDGDATLASIVTPTYPFGGKRPLRDNGLWIRTLKRDDVSIITDAIDRITPAGIVTADGIEHPFDVLIYGTGFHASDFLRGIEVKGQGGRNLHERWAGDARAYLGIAVPDFPNLFLLYGPNTNIAVNGSIIFILECAVNYVIDCLRIAAEVGATAIEVREEVYNRFNEEVDAANRMRAWGVEQSQSWYKSASGRVSQNWPHRLIDYWYATRHADPGEFRLDRKEGVAATAGQENVDAA